MLTLTAFTLDQLEEKFVELYVKHTAPFQDTLATVPMLFTQMRILAKLPVPPLPPMVLQLMPLVQLYNAELTTLWLLLPLETLLLTALTLLLLEATFVEAIAKTIAKLFLMLALV